MGGAGFAVAALNSLTMTIATEIGDKTFCIAAVLAMRYPRGAVFTGAILALIAMTVLSVAIGVAVPTLLPKVYTHYAAAALFAYFGVKLLREAADVPAQETGGAPGSAHSGGGGGGELAEAEAEVAKLSIPGGEEKREEAVGAGGAAAPALELTAMAGINGAPSDPEAAAAASAARARNTVTSAAAVPSAPPAPASITATATSASAVALFLAAAAKHWPVASHSFTITFLAEWGDRSQIATIAMAAAQNALGVCLGAVLGHSLCTGIAVIGGRMLASRISERTVAYIGGTLFLVFALHSLIVGPDVDE